MANQFYPNQKNKHNNWYGFANFREQLSWAALLGLSASVCSILAVFLSPPFAMAACSLSVISNIFWMIGEYHKTKVPPHYDEHFSLSKQKSFAQYTMCMTVLSIIAAAATITGFLAPAALSSLLIVVIPVAILTVCLAINRWIDYNFGNHALLIEPDAILDNSPEVADSYQSMSKTLNLSAPLDPDLEIRIETPKAPAALTTTPIIPSPSNFTCPTAFDTMNSLSYN